MDKLTPKQRRQLELYQANKGAEATERQLTEARRCTYRGGELPGGHSRGCRFYLSSQRGKP